MWRAGATRGDAVLLCGPARPRGSASATVRGTPQSREARMTWSPQLTQTMEGSELQSLTLGLSPVDEYLQFVGARCRLNTWLATAYDLLVFFSAIRKEPTAVTTADVFTFLQIQRAPRNDPKLVRL